MRRGTLAFRFFLAMLAVTLVSVLATGLVVRGTFGRAFRAYLAMPHRPGMAPGAGRNVMMGVAERSFTTGVERGILLGALVAVVVALVAAVLLARRLSASLADLTHAAQSLAGGDLTHRVSVEGPSEVEALGAAFNEMADSLEQSESLRRRMVADVAHELRNPVASVRAQAEGMAEGVLAADPARLASVVDDLEHLSRLVDDLQELTVAEAGRLAYDLVDADLGTLAAREAERVRESVAEGVDVAAEIAEDLPPVRLDVQRISQVLRNVLSNAARHTRRGSITVRCFLTGEGVAVEVWDTGEGIAAAELPYIFERFYRADSARSRDRGGAGIGLAIARRIVEDHGGRMYADSVLGEGTTVGFVLPRAGGRAGGRAGNRI